MIPKDFVKSRLESPVFEKSGRDFKGWSLNQPMNVQSFMETMMEENTNLNVTDRYSVFKNTSTDRQIPILDQPQSASILSIAIPLLIAGIIVLFFAVCVGVRCKRKRDRANYGEDYEFSLVDQSIQANQSSIIGHAVIMANGTEYHEIGELMDQTRDSVHGVLSLPDDQQSGEIGGHVLETENRTHIEQQDENIGYVLEKEIHSHGPRSEGNDETRVDGKVGNQDGTSPHVCYTNEYFSLENCNKSPYFVLEKGDNFVYVNER